MAREFGSLAVEDRRIARGGSKNHVPAPKQQSDRPGREAARARMPAFYAQGCRVERQILGISELAQSTGSSDRIKATTAVCTRAEGPAAARPAASTPSARSAMAAAWARSARSIAAIWSASLRRGRRGGPEPGKAPAAPPASLDSAEGNARRKRPRRYPTRGGETGISCAWLYGRYDGQHWFPSRSIHLDDTGSAATRERFDTAKSSRNSRSRVAVMLPYPFQGPFDYRVPPELDPKPGDLVVVPLNQREEIGVVWDAPAGGGVPDSKLKPLIAILDTPPMLEPLRRFVDWVAAYTLSPPGEVMAMALRVVEPEPGPLRRNGRQPIRRPPAS